jgi:hypothetical protein|tara:strand:+ start:313 stop:519 length:207 start_codon:yes stop_codon:yes gene_type:complete
MKIFDVEIEQDFTRTKTVRIIASDENDLVVKLEEKTQGDARRIGASDDWNVSIIAIHDEAEMPDATKF